MLVVAHTWKKKHVTKPILDLFQMPNDVVEEKENIKQLPDTYVGRVVQSV